MCRQRNKKAKDVMYGRLRILVEQKYIGMNYSQADRKQGKPAVYYLMPDGIQALAARPGFNAAVLHAAYIDRKVGEEFISHCLNIFTLYRKFEQLYTNRYKMLTKSETSGFDYYPKPLPDLHLSDQENDGDYFLDLIDESVSSYTLRRKLTGYAEHYDSGDWEDKTDNDYPTILLVCSTPKIERVLQRRVPRLINTDDLTVYTTSYKALIESSTSDDEIWTDVEEPDELTSISEGSSQ